MILLALVSEDARRLVHEPGRPAFGTHPEIIARSPVRTGRSMCQRRDPTAFLCCAQLRGVVHAADGVGVLTAIASAADGNGSVAQLAANAALTAAERVQLRAFLLQVSPP